MKGIVLLLFYYYVNHLRKDRINSRLKATSENLSDAAARALEAILIVSCSERDKALSRQSANESTESARKPVGLPSYSVTMSRLGPAELCATGINPAACYNDNKYNNKQINK